MNISMHEIKFKSVWSGVMVIAVASLLNSCGHSSAHEPGEGKENPSPTVVETFVLQRENFSTNLQLPGELVAFQQVDLYAKVTGFVKELKVDIGSEVKTGQVLVTLDAPELQSQLTALESRLKSQEAVYTASNANYKRLVETSKTPGTISQNDLDLAEAKKNSDLANLDAARASFKEIRDVQNYLVIRAPFDGIITARSVNLGAYVGPSGKGSEFPVFTLQQQKKLRLVISLSEAYTNYLRQGDEVTFRVRSFPSAIFKAKVQRMSGALDLRLRAERIEFDIDNSDRKLLPGGVAEVSIPLSAKEKTFIVPRSTLVNSSEGLFVVKIVKGKVERVPVKKGLEDNTQIEIFGSLSEHDTLTLKGNDEMKTGMAVESKVKRVEQK